MSDAAVANLVSALVTICTMIVGFLTLWVRLRYGDKVAEAKSQIVENKLDDNTNMTREAKEAATKASEHVVGCDEERARLLKGLSDHDSRIVALEGQMNSLRTSVDGLAHNIDSTRHEMRGHLQTVTNKLDLIGLHLPRKKEEGPA